jgi:hypothetical protein
MDIVNRPFKEIQFKPTKANLELLEEIETWAADKCQYSHNQSSEYIIIMPHPKHPGLGGQSFSEFTEECPDLLKNVLETIYNDYISQMHEEKWTSDFDLDNDFGYIAIVML